MNVKIKNHFALALAALCLVSCGAKEGTSSISALDSEAGVYRKDEVLALRCGTDIGFSEETIGGSDITKDCDEQGQIVSVEYDSYAYGVELLEGDYKYQDFPIKKHMNIYLPYGYDENSVDTKYDVLILCHGSGENEDFWFGMGNYDRTDNISSYLKGYGTHQVLDNMMKQGKATKSIVVTPSLYADAVIGGESKSIETDSMFDLEAINDILPYVISHYHTYAEGTARENIVAARDHFGYAGLSYGGNVSINAIWLKAFDCFSYIGTLSTPYVDENASKIVDLISTTEYKCNYWLTCTGTLDGGMQMAVDGYLKVMDKAKDGFFKNGSDLSLGCNSDLVLVNKTGHSYACWLTGLYNLMHVFFK